MKVEFMDLKAQYRTIKPEIDRAIQAVIDTSDFVSGPAVKRFEEAFARTHEAPHCVGVNSGTSALHVVLWALGIGPGDEVIVPASTFFATAEAVSLLGAKPVFADCDPIHYDLDPVAMEALITPKTKAVIPVHLYGNPARMLEIKAITEKHGLHLVEDCAQAHLAEYGGRKVGNFGIAGCFSFYPGKNLGAYGEAGAVITSDAILEGKIRSLREHGSLQKYHHDEVGHNYRMEGMQGAVLEVKLKHLAAWTERRRQIADLYRHHLSDCESIVLPRETENGKHVYHVFVVRVPRRDAVQAFLRERGVFTGIHYPIPCHLQKAYSHLGFKPGALPNAERFSGEVLSLPMFPELRDDEVSYVSGVLKDALTRSS